MNDYSELGRQIVAFMGPEGVGKSNIGRRLASEFHKPFISTGDILREKAVNDRTEFGDECRAALAEKRYLNPQMLLNILSARFRQEDTANGFVFDGGFRTVEEVLGLPSVFEETNRIMPVTIVYLRIPSWRSIHQLVTGDKARRREDDTIEGVFNRLANFYDRLGLRTSLIRQQENWDLLHINALGYVDETYSKVIEALKTKTEN